MDARFYRAAALAAIAVSFGASYRTQNFVVNAPTPEAAQQIGDLAEVYRRDLAIEWIGKELPNWSRPCPITAHVSPTLGAGGATSFVFDKGEVFGWEMEIQGSIERILDSVLPHEVTHTIFASHFRQPLPRWADEGACTTVEASSERRKQQIMLVDFLKTGRGISFSRMFRMKEYPQDILPLYAQGHSLASYLIAQGGKHKFMNYVADGLAAEQWTEVTQRHYSYSNLAELQDSWLDWVRRGSPLPLDVSSDGAPVALASAQRDVPATPATEAAPQTPPAATDSVYSPGNHVQPAPVELPPAPTAAAQPMPQPSKNAIAATALLDDDSAWRASHRTVANAPVVMPEPAARQQVPQTAATDRREGDVLLEWQRGAALLDTRANADTVLR